jgi:hypothetical protein
MLRFAYANLKIKNKRSSQFLHVLKHCGILAKKSMICLKDIIPITLSEKYVLACLDHSKKCCIGGRSHIRENFSRKLLLNDDQFIGQLCTCAATMWLAATPERGFSFYDRVRCKQNLNPYNGDGGDDIPPYRVDIKGSTVRNHQKSVLSYNLLVRPAERHNDWIYVFALSDPPRVALVGWAFDNQLPDVPESCGIFNGAYRVVAADLNKMSELSQLLSSKERELVTAGKLDFRLRLQTLQ